MAVTYGYFNSVSGDRTYNADQMSEYFDGLVSNGVYESVGGALQVLAGTGLSVNVQTGRAIVNCKWIKNDAVLNLTLTTAHAILNRYTAVILKLDIDNRLMTITTKDGENAATPTKPTMQNDDSVKELCLAYIYVAAGAESISQSNIEDMRASNLCGWVTGVVQQVDTSTLFLQWQTAYQEYYDRMTQEFTDWLDTLTEELLVETFVKKYYKRSVYVAGGSNHIPMDMNGYEYNDDDIINIYINGLLATPGTDYTIDISGETPVLTTTASAVGTEVIIIVLKSKIGFNTLIGSDGAIVVGSDNAQIIGG